MVKDSEKIKNLISKVEKLADRGDSGEKENAKAKLKILLEKYNIKKFEEQKNKERSFKLSDFVDCKTIMVHCILDTKKDSEITGDARKKELYCKLNDKEYIDVCEKFNHYYPLYHRQKDALINAFIIKNNLGIVDSDIDVSSIDIDSIKEIIDSVDSKRFQQGRIYLDKENPYLKAC
jgi:hypothetical protein